MMMNLHIEHANYGMIIPVDNSKTVKCLKTKIIDECKNKFDTVLYLDNINLVNQMNILKNDDKLENTLIGNILYLAIKPIKCDNH